MWSQNKPRSHHCIADYFTQVDFCRRKKGFPIRQLTPPSKNHFVKYYFQLCKNTLQVVNNSWIIIGLLTNPTCGLDNCFKNKHCRYLTRATEITQSGSQSILIEQRKIIPITPSEIGLSEASNQDTIRICKKAIQSFLAPGSSLRGLLIQRWRWESFQGV